MRKCDIEAGFWNGKHRNRRTSRGTSVIELMIAMSVVAIILTLGVPSYSAVTHKNKVNTASSLLYTSLNVARGEALKRRKSVRVCPSVDSVSCRNDGDWSTGWLIFEDANANNSPEAPEIIRLVESMENGVGIEVSDSIEDYLQFEPSGVATGNSGNTGEFRICHSDSGAASQALRISAAGHVEHETRNLTNCSAAG